LAEPPGTTTMNRVAWVADPILLVVMIVWGAWLEDRSGGVLG
jgi:hypothetical protein